MRSRPWRWGSLQRSPDPLSGFGEGKEWWRQGRKKARQGNGTEGGKKRKWKRRERKKRKGKGIIHRKEKEREGQTPLKQKFWLRFCLAAIYNCLLPHNIFPAPPNILPARRPCRRPASSTAARSGCVWTVGLANCCQRVYAATLLLEGHWTTIRRTMLSVSRSWRSLWVETTIDRARYTARCQLASSSRQWWSRQQRVSTVQSRVLWPVPLSAACRRRSVRPVPSVTRRAPVTRSPWRTYCVKVALMYAPRASLSPAHNRLTVQSTPLHREFSEEFWDTKFWNLMQIFLV